MSQPIVVFDGEIFSESSLSRVNRELALALIRAGDVEVALTTERRGHYYDQATAATDALRGRVGATVSRAPDLTIRHRWPPDFTRPETKRYVHIQPWEYGELPLEWIAPIQTSADEVWCYSAYIQDMYARAGIDTSSLWRFPLGVDPNIFRVDGLHIKVPGEGKFRFLFFGGTIWRKGIDLALNAYLRAFTASDNVCLIIKDVGTTTSYAGQTQHEHIRSLIGRKDIPEIAYLDETLDDLTIAALYRSVDVLLHPYRGEGFALPVLEAMACGTPAIVTEGGATDDFVDETVGMRLKAERIPVPLELPMHAPGWALEIALDRLVHALRLVAGNPAAIGVLGNAAALRVASSWTWDKSAAFVTKRAFAASES